MSGPSGLRAPGPVGLSQFPATEAVAAPSPRLEEQPALANRRCTVGWESKSRGNPARSSPSVQVRQPAGLPSSCCLKSLSVPAIKQQHLLWFLQSTVPGALGRPGLIATHAPARPRAPGSATAPPAGSEACLASERAGRGGVAMTTPPSVLVSIIKFCLLVRLNIDLSLASYIKGRRLCKLK